MTSNTGGPPFDPDEGAGPPGDQSQGRATGVHYRVDSRPDELQIAADLPGTRWGTIGIRLADNGYLELVTESNVGYVNERIPIPKALGEDDLEKSFNNGVLVIQCDTSEITPDRSS